jgi:hypothetical protein
VNSSLLTADAPTHAKIVIVALLAGIVVIWIGIGTQLRGVKLPSAGPHIEMQAPKPGGKPLHAPAPTKAEIV